MGIPKVTTVELRHVVCCHDGCDALIIMPTHVMQQFRDNHKFWYCYRGHAQHFAGESDKEKLKEQLRHSQKLLEWANQSVKAERVRADRIERSLVATKGHVTRQKKRAAAGVCPCCNRTFKQLAAHMRRKHPDYVSEKGRRRT